jgi:hypothetical protein
MQEPQWRQSLDIKIIKNICKIIILWPLGTKNNKQLNFINLIWWHTCEIGLVGPLETKLIINLNSKALIK